MLTWATSHRTRLRGATARPRRSSSAVLQLVRRHDVVLPLVYFGIGFVPITSLALALFAIVPLHIAARALTLPVGLAIALGIWQPVYGRLALRGYAIGLVAVLVYDLTRVPPILMGIWPDFIPNIGALLLQREEGHAVLGYTWRWLGNGAGMGMAFFMAYPLVARWLPVRLAGPLFGVLVWACLLATLLLAPLAPTLLFALTPVTFAVSLFGHLVFGGTLGLIMWKTSMNVRPYVSDLSGDGVPAGATDPVPA